MKAAGILMIVLALVIGIVPMFTDCASEGKSLTTADGRSIPMKCHWTARAEIALAVPLLGVGGMMLFSKRRETRRNLSLMGILLGAFVIALPTALIGVCMNPDMICNAVMKPSLILSGSMVVALSGLGLLQSLRAKEEKATWAFSN